MAWTEQESVNRRRKVGDLSMLLRPAESLQNGAGFSGKTRNKLGLPKKERVASAPQSEQLGRTPKPLLPRKTNRALGADCKMGQSQGEREPHLGKKEKD